jgi:hypothetical protein
MKDISQKENKMENEITKKEFEFKMNEYKDVIHVLMASFNSSSGQTTSQILS